MAEGEVRQYFVRNEQGTIWGPLALPTIELLIDNGVIQGKLQVSEDGINFAFPGRFPHLRDSFPRETWGDVVPPGPSAPAPAPGAPAAAPRAVTRPPIAGAGVPVAGPGIPRAPVAGAGVPIAGPGITRPPVSVPAAGPGAVARHPAPGPPGAGPAVTRAPVPGAGVPTAGPGAVARPPAPGAGPAVTRAPVPGAGLPTAGPGAARPPAPVAPAQPAAQAPGVPPPAAAAPAPAVMRPSGTFTSVAPASEEPPPANGTLETHSPVRLYGLIAAGNHTGLLTLTLPDCAVSIHFRKGNPEFIDSSHPEDALGAWLLQAKLATAEQLQQAEAARGRFGGELLAALFGLGLLQPASAFTQLAHRAQAILLKGLRAESGSFTFEPKELPAAKAMPLGNKWAVLSDLVRRIPSTDLRRRLQPVLNLPVMKSNGRVATGDLRLTPHEVRVLALIDGVRSIGQLLNDIPQDADHLLRLVFLLKELEGVSFAAVAPRAPAPPPAQAGAPAAQPAAKTAPPVAPAAKTAPPVAPAAKTAPPVAPAAKPAAPPAAAPQAARAATAPGVPQAGATPQATAPRPAAPASAAAPQAPAAKPASPPPSAKPAAPAAAAPPAAKPAAPAPASAPAAAPGSAPGASELPALRELAEKMKDQNHFERLGLGADTNGPAVKIAYFKLAKQYHPDTLPPGAPPELEKLKADVFAYIGEAYRALSDDKGRAAYIEDLKTGGSKPAQVDVEAILKSEELFRKAGLYIKARKFADAVKLLDEAIQLNPEEPEFFAWRGYARFFTFEDKKAGFNEAYKDIQQCLKQNDKVASGHYFLGVIAKLCGDTSGALKHFQKTVEVQPNHIDAQREIRMATQKK
ncbi:DnaJ domain-containing protein [Archangium violaceum]|uniref:J domain-containing protein n=1 Tax=Archangium violaceum TaxID=83451 RepID=UPI002B28F5E4|nr:DnaJ domain-containing protein [Archangium gephyra]